MANLLAAAQKAKRYADLYIGMGPKRKLRRVGSLGTEPLEWTLPCLPQAIGPDKAAKMKIEGTLDANAVAPYLFQFRSGDDVQETDEIQQNGFWYKLGAFAEAEPIDGIIVKRSAIGSRGAKVKTDS